MSKSSLSSQAIQFLILIASTLTTSFNFIDSIKVPMQTIGGCLSSKFGDYSIIAGNSGKNGPETFIANHYWTKNSIEILPIPWLTRSFHVFQLNPEVLAISGEGGAIFLNLTSYQRIRGESDQILDTVDIKSTIFIYGTNFLSLMGFGFEKNFIIDSNRLKILKEITIPKYQRRQLSKKHTPYIFMTGHKPGLELVDYTIGFFFEVQIKPIFIGILTKTDYIFEGTKAETILYGGNNGYIFLANTTSLQAIEDYNLGNLPGNTNNKFKIHNIFPGGELIAVYGFIDSELMIYNLETKSFVIKLQITGGICSDLDKSRISKLENDILFFYKILSQHSCSDSHCSKCDYSPDICQACKNPKFSFNYTCVDECPSGFQKSSKLGACILNPCLENQILKQDNTCGCREGEEIKMQVCVCVDEICCAENEFFNEGQCNLCKEGSIFSKEKKECINCQEANNKCKSCISGTLECKKCEEGYELRKNGECILKSTNPAEQVVENFAAATAKIYKVVYSSTAFVNSEIKRNSLRLYQAIQFLSLLERDYDKLTTKLMNIFIDSFYSTMDIRIFAPKEESQKIRKDKISENLDQNFFKNTDSSLQLALVNIFFSILMILLKKIYKGKETVFYSFISIYNIAFIIETFGQFAVEFILAACIGIFYNQESNKINFVVSFLTILLYVLLIIFIWIGVYYYPTEKIGTLIFYRMCDLKPIYKYKKRNILFTANWMLINCLQSFFVIVFRGNLIFQSLILAALQLIPLVIWCSNRTIFIFESKTKAIMEFVKELVTFLVLLISTFHHSYLDKILFILIIAQILLSGASTFLEIFWSINYIVSLESKEKKPDVDDEKRRSRIKFDKDKGMIRINKKALMGFTEDKFNKNEDFKGIRKDLEKEKINLEKECNLKKNKYASKAVEVINNFTNKRRFSRKTNTVKPRRFSIKYKKPFKRSRVE